MPAESAPVSEAGPSPDLVARIIARDPGAEEELVHRYSRGVSFILSGSIANPSAVEDLRQETFRIALEKIRNGDVREPERLSGFVCGVAHNLARAYFRQSSRREVTGAGDAAILVADPAPSPMQQLLRAENARIVRQVLGEVTPARYRQILYRYYVADEEKDQICADLGLTSVHFNCVLQRARDRYRELYTRAIEKQQRGKGKK